MERDKYKKTSVFLSLVLRHNPEAAGIRIDGHGWADVSELIEGVNQTGRRINQEILEEIVRTDEKGRYSFNEDKTKIRANQGHSISVDVELKKTAPPQVLYHGTATRFLGSILEKKEGLKPAGRLYVHLSKDYPTAVNVGARHGIPAVLEVESGQMEKDGYSFYLSENGVWLTKKVPCQYLKKVKRPEI